MQQIIMYGVENNSLDKRTESGKITVDYYYKRHDYINYNSVKFYTRVVTSQ